MIEASRTGQMAKNSKRDHKIFGRAGGCAYITQRVARSCLFYAIYETFNCAAEEIDVGR